MEEISPSALIETVYVAKKFLDRELRKYETWEEFLTATNLNHGEKSMSNQRFGQLKTQGIGHAVIREFLGDTGGRVGVDD